VKPCAACGFLANDYDQRDAMGTLRALAPVWRTMTDGLEPSVLAALIVNATATADALGAPTTDADAALPDVVASIENAVAELHRASPNAEALSERVHTGVHELHLAGRTVHALSAGAPAQTGTLVQVNASGGGVPKTPLASAVVGRRGVVGDTQAERAHHGKPMQALSLWSAEVIDALRGEGHPIYAGAAGENLTVSGIQWTTIRPGVQLAIGDVLAEVSAFATPCAKNAQWFSDRNFRRIDHANHPGWSRAYAWVHKSGTVAPGDPIIVEPAEKIIRRPAARATNSQ
jgi:MOSC domain-containing protein YiiM